VTAAKRATLAAAVVAALAAVVPARAGAQDLGRYREFALGAGIDEVLTATRTSAADVTVVHRQPRLLQELVWQPRYTAGRSLTADAAREIRFRFLDDELFEIVVLYDAYEIEGLTAPDLIKAVSAVYGAPVARPGAALGRWQNDHVRITLSEASYPTPYRLALVSSALEERALAVAVEAERLDRLAAPAADAARVAAAADQRRVDDAATREKNRIGFRP
jgi:hypothetical protein